MIAKVKTTKFKIKNENRARGRTESAVYETTTGNGIYASNVPEGFTTPLVEVVSRFPVRRGRI